jgi:hypothetical protein
MYEREKLWSSVEAAAKRVEEPGLRALILAFGRASRPG